MHEAEMFVFFLRFEGMFFVVFFCLHFFGLFSQKASFLGETLFGEKHEIFTLLEEAVYDFPFGSRDIWTGDDFEPEILKAYRNLAD